MTKTSTNNANNETLSYQREVDKGKLTAVTSFEKLTFRA